MEDVFDSAWQDRAAASDNTIEAELASLLDIHGLALLGKSGHIRRLLLEAFPDQRPRIAAILGALSAGIPSRLQMAKNDAAMPALLQECVLKLQDEGGLEAAPASFAVRAWAYALALPTTGLDGVVNDGDGPRIARSPDVPGAPPAPSPPSFFVFPAAASEAAPHAPRQPPGAAAPDARRDADRPATVAAPDPRSSSSRVASVVDQTPPVPPTVRREPTLQDDLHRSTIHGEPRSPQAATNSPEPSFTPTAPAESEGAIPMEPLFAERDPGNFAHDAPGASANRPLPMELPPLESRTASEGAPFTAPGDLDPDPAAVDAENTEPFVPPVWERPTWTPTRSRTRPVVIVGASAALALAIGLGFVAEQRMGDHGSPSPSLARNDAAVPKVPSTANTENPARIEGPATPASDPRADHPATPSPVVSASSDNPTGSTSARGTPGPSMAPEPSDSSPPAQGASPSPSGAEGAPQAPRAEAAAPATPAEPPDRSADTPVAAGANDRRSNLSSRTPGPAARPTIVGVDVPRVVEGAPFAVVLRVAGDARKIASIERRIVDSGGGWPRGGDAMQSAHFRRSGATALAVSFRAMDAPAHAVVELTAVDHDGTRSLPAIARIAVVAPTAARGSDPTAPVCAASTCGTVVEARELVSAMDARTPLYQIVVRMDDRQTQAFSAPYRLQAGSRVQKSGDRFSPIGTSPQ